jgi:hypothetical protein
MLICYLWVYSLIFYVMGKFFNLTSQSPMKKHVLNSQGTPFRAER